jgi:hypothetical protein
MTEQRKPPQGCGGSPRKPKSRAAGGTTLDTTAVVQMWRHRCWALEEQLQDTTRALRAAEEERRELSADYKHALDKLWRQGTGYPLAKDTTNASS